MSGIPRPYQASGPIQPATRTLRTALHTRMAPLAADTDVPGAVAAVMRDGQHAVLATGVRDTRTGTAMTADTVFEIGSVTKTFTALLLATMAELHEVAYHDPIDLHLPEHGTPRPAGAPLPTLEELATHTAGLKRLPRGLIRRAGLRLRSDPYARYTSGDLYRATARLRPRPPHRRTERYSTFGMGLLGQLLSDAAGIPYPALLADRVLRPLGMTSTIATGEAAAADTSARGHRGGKPVPAWTFDALAGAGAVRSTAADLMRYTQAHLRPESTALAPALTATQRVRPDGTCLGWQHRLIEGANLYWHTGGTGGCTAFVGFCPDTAGAVVLLANAAPSWRQPVIRTGRQLFRDVVFGP